MGRFRRSYESLLVVIRVRERADSEPVRGSLTAGPDRPFEPRETVRFDSRAELERELGRVVDQTPSRERARRTSRDRTDDTERDREDHRGESDPVDPMQEPDDVTAP